LEPTKIKDSLPQLQTSERKSQHRKSSCQECGKEAERLSFETFNGDWLRVCPACVPKVRKRETKRQGEKLAEKIIPKLFQSARIEHLSGGLRKKIETLPDDKGLLLWGSQGVGKSYAMSAILRSFLLDGRKANRISYEMLCLRLRDTYKDGSTKTEFGVIQNLIETDKLFLEDVGTTVSGGNQEKDFSLRTFLVLLDQRLEHCRATFITTNKPVEELAKSFDPRVSSRLQQGCEIVHLTGADRRARG
jgi:DNA replication protein DnaC